jgi:hypothetical protein
MLQHQSPKRSQKLHLKYKSPQTSNICISLVGFELSAGLASGLGILNYSDSHSFLLRPIHLAYTVVVALEA